MRDIPFKQMACEVLEIERAGAEVTVAKTVCLSPSQPSTPPGIVTPTK